MKKVEQKTLQEQCINWCKQRLINFFDNILNIIGSGIIAYLLFKFVDISIK